MNSRIHTMTFILLALCSHLSFGQTPPSGVDSLDWDRYMPVAEPTHTGVWHVWPTQYLLKPDGIRLSLRVKDIGIDDLRIAYYETCPGLKGEILGVVKFTKREYTSVKFNNPDAIPRLEKIIQGIGLGQMLCLKSDDFRQIYDGGKKSSDEWIEVPNRQSPHRWYLNMARFALDFKNITVFLKVVGPELEGEVFEYQVSCDKDTDEQKAIAFFDKQGNRIDMDTSPDEMRKILRKLWPDRSVRGIMEFPDATVLELARPWAKPLCVMRDYVGRQLSAKRGR